MILATHSLTGAVVGKYVNNTWLIIILSVILHFILDTFRHGEYLNRKSSIREFWKVAIDFFVGVSAVLLIANFNNYPSYVLKNMLIGAFFSMFPDFFTLLYWKLGVKFLKPLFDFHAWFHLHPLFSKEREWNLRSAANDIVILILAVFLLII